MNHLLIVGFQSGTLEVRKAQTGDIVFTTKLEGSGSVAKVFFYDYRMSGSKQVVVVTTTGKIIGYTIQSQSQQTQVSHDHVSKEASEKLLSLNRRKIELQNKV